MFNISKQVHVSAQQKKLLNVSRGAKTNKVMVSFENPLNIYFRAWPHVLMETINSRYNVFGVGVWQSTVKMDIAEHLTELQENLP
uniref:Uncharacterized protein n=1 Tax=Anguilla anguilla TaxID=7936 RepID=A0A0E9WBH0_ANGAN